MRDALDMRCGIVAAAVLASIALFGNVVSAQEAKPSIAGIVRDSSGGVMPGVTVEIASPALIEKTRSTVTDGSGQFRIIDLQAGTYSVTFQLSGFTTLKREGVEVSGGGVITVNAELKVGSLAETVTVAGETPTVDVQSGKREAVLSNDIVASHSDRAQLFGPAGGGAVDDSERRRQPEHPAQCRFDGGVWRPGRSWQ